MKKQLLALALLLVPAFMMAQDAGQTIENPMNERLTLGTEPLFRMSAVLNTPNSIPDETVIYFSTDATNAFDPDFDATKVMNSDPLVPNLYTRMGNDNLAINGLEPIGSVDVVVPLRCIVGTSGTYELNAMQIINFSPNVDVYLEDLDSNYTQNLKLNHVYLIQRNPGDNPDRFQIRFHPQISTGIAEESAEVNIGSDGINLWVNVKESGSDLYVYNIAGQLVYSSRNLSAGMHAFDLNEFNGLHLVQLKKGDNATTTKIHLR